VIKSNVSTAHELNPVKSVARRDSGADADADKSLGTGNFEWPSGCFDQPLAYSFDRVSRGHLPDEDHELVSTYAGDCVILTRESFEPVSECTQKFITGGVPESVVNRLEAIQVEVKNRDFFS
jgi:hypothetical protein